MKQVPWTKDLVGKFVDMALLSDDEIYIMTTRVKGYTVTRQALELHKSEATVHRMISVLKKKYDIVQKENPDIFPIRKSSTKEVYMDNN